MTITLFLLLYTVGAMICILLTEAIKKAFENAHKTVAPNFIALINALLVGVVGTIFTYVLLGVPFSVNNIICLILMCVLIWIGSMIGFDKGKQLIEQIAVILGAKKE